ncbi:MAG: ATP synthase F1 subunit gamma [Muribaculaceae bacterium]
MATLRELKGRIGSVSSSEKITGAMKMISSAKMHKAEMALRRLVPYRNQIQSVIGHLLSADGEYSSPLIEIREVKKIAMVVFGSDDGLCGAYNIQVFKNMLITIAELRTKYGDNVELDIYPVGNKIIKATSKIADKSTNVIVDKTMNTRSTLDEVRMFTDGLKNNFISGKVDKVIVLYNYFKSASKQYIQLDTLLPVSYHDLVAGATSSVTNKPCLFEPDANTIFNSVLPLYILSVMQEVVAENNASEQAARVMAMQSANDNAKNLLEDLRLVYNNLRQQSITTELLDILGGQTDR